MFASNTISPDKIFSLFKFKIGVGSKNAVFSILGALSRMTSLSINGRIFKALNYGHCFK